MNKLSLLILYVFVSGFFSSPLLALSLKVEAGGTYRLHSGVTTLDLDELILEDGATLHINNGAPSIVIRSPHVEIGENVSIVGIGRDGEPGKNGLGYSNPAIDCSEPLDGLAGSKGGDGRDGVNLNLHWTIVSFGSLEVDLRGGAAGKGGRGGSGQDADQSAQCKLQRGGDAGAGAMSGRSGSGGDFTFVYRGDELNEQIRRVPEQTRVKNESGAKAESGESGKAGLGSVGRYVQKKSLVGNRSWVAGGKPGDVPKTPKPGAEGRDGESVFRFDALQQSVQQASEQEGVRIGASSKSDIDRTALEQRVKALESELKRLSERVSELESSP